MGLEGDSIPFGVSFLFSRDISGHQPQTSCTIIGEILQNLPYICCLFDPLKKWVQIEWPLHFQGPFRGDLGCSETADRQWQCNRTTKRLQLPKARKPKCLYFEWSPPWHVGWGFVRWGLLSACWVSWFFGFKKQNAYIHQTSVTKLLNFK